MGPDSQGIPHLESRFKNLTMKTFIRHISYFTSLNSPYSKVNWPELFGTRGPLVSAHKLANLYINKGKIITANEVNSVLAFSGISITQGMLDTFLSRPILEFSNLDSTTVRSDRFIQLVGTVRGKAVPGVYIYSFSYRRYVRWFIFCISS